MIFTITIWFDNSEINILNPFTKNLLLLLSKIPSFIIIDEYYIEKKNG